MHKSCHRMVFTKDGVYYCFPIFWQPQNVAVFTFCSASAAASMSASSSMGSSPSAASLVSLFSSHLKPLGRWIWGDLWIFHHPTKIRKKWLFLLVKTMLYMLYYSYSQKSSNFTRKNIGISGYPSLESCRKWGGCPKFRAMLNHVFMRKVMIN